MTGSASRSPPNSRDERPPAAVLAWLAELLGETPGDCRRMRGRDGNAVYRLCGRNHGVVFLKCGRGLLAERDRLDWLARRSPIPVPTVLGWAGDEAGDRLAVTGIAGSDLAAPDHLAHPAATAGLLAEALARLHRTDATGCPFGLPSPNAVLGHGDACLPNVLARRGIVTGLVDLGDSGLDHRETDLSAAVWSLQRNLGPGWGHRFLDAYGYPARSDADLEALRRRYGE